MLELPKRPIGCLEVIKQGGVTACKIFRSTVLLGSLPAACFILSLFIRPTELPSQGMDVLRMLASMITMVGGVLMAAVLTAHIHHKSIQANASVDSAFDLVFKKLWTLIKAMFLVSLLVFIGNLLFVFPGIFLFFLFFFYIPLILFENQTALKSLSGSAKLVWGHWWQTFWIFFIPFAMGVFLSAIFGPAHPLLRVGFSFVLTTLLTLLISILVVIQFNNLKQQKQV